jgi:exosortase
MESRGARLRCWAFAIPVILYVALLSFWPLASHWSADPQYHFGYLVPALTLFLAALRWKSRPAPKASGRSAVVLAAVLFAMFLPAWIVLQPNPDWRLLNWSATGLCVAFLLACAAALGGTAWARHFAFPAFFLLTAVPWPTELEWPVTQGLMRGVATTAAEVLSLCGIPAIAQGNLVEIASGTLGVDVACSGIRSLQPSLMMALFLGEVFRFDLSRRLALFFAAVVIAVITNVGRVLILASVAAAKGFSAIDAWHDPAGTLLMTICFALTWGAALLIGRGYSPAQSGDVGGAARVPPWGWSCLGMLWIAASVGAGEAWYRHGPAQTGTPWTFTVPDEAQSVPIDAEARAMLRFDRGAGWKWQAGPAQEWIGYDMIWDSGPARSRMLLSMHRPDICLAAVGLRLLEDRGVIWAEANGVRIPFQAYVFESSRGPLHVYYALYRAGEPVLERESSVRNACLRAVTEGRRTVDQRVLQLAVAGTSRAQSADAALAELLRATLSKR